jgi:hypothetical protein
VRLRRLVQNAQPVPGIEGAYTHDDVVVPMLAGVRRPMILLPSSAMAWPVPEVKAILLHERAHFIRRDHVVGSMVDAAMVLYWLNPLVWLAVTMVEQDRERACDDEVLQTGVKPSVYAAALMRVALRLPEPTSIRGTLTMGGGQLAVRIRTILSEPCRRPGRVPVSWSVTAVLILVCALAVTSIRMSARTSITQADDTLVTVNGETLTRMDLQRRQRNVQLAPITQPPVDPASPPAERVLVESIDEILIVQHGRQLGYLLSDEQFRSVVANIRANQKLETESAFDEALTRQDLTVGDLRLSLERQMIYQRVVFNEVFSKVAVTENDARSYFAAHADQFPQVSYERVRDRIRDDLLTGNRQQAFGAYLARLRSQAVFEWATADLKRTYDALARQSGR